MISCQDNIKEPFQIDVRKKLIGNIASFDGKLISDMNLRGKKLKLTKNQNQIFNEQKLINQKFIMSQNCLNCSKNQQQSEKLKLFKEMIQRKFQESPSINYVFPRCLTQHKDNSFDMNMDIDSEASLFDTTTYNLQHQNFKQYKQKIQSQHRMVNQFANDGHKRNLSEDSPQKIKMTITGSTLINQTQIKPTNKKQFNEKIINATEKIQPQSCKNQNQIEFGKPFLLSRNPHQDIRFLKRQHLRGRSEHNLIKQKLTLQEPQISAKYSTNVKLRTRLMSQINENENRNSPKHTQSLIWGQQTPITLITMDSKQVLVTENSCNSSQVINTNNVTNPINHYPPPNIQVGNENQIMCNADIIPNKIINRNQKPLIKQTAILNRRVFNIQTLNIKKQSSCIKAKQHLSDCVKAEKKQLQTDRDKLDKFHYESMVISQNGSHTLAQVVTKHELYNPSQPTIRQDTQTGFFTSRNFINNINHVKQNNNVKKNTNPLPKCIAIGSNSFIKSLLRMKINIQNEDEFCGMQRAEFPLTTINASGHSNNHRDQKEMQMNETTQFTNHVILSEQSPQNKVFTSKYLTSLDQSKIFKFK